MKFANYDNAFKLKDVLADDKIILEIIPSKKDDKLKRSFLKQMM